jgi:hypothetical protein
MLNKKGDDPKTMPFKYLISLKTQDSKLTTA